MAHSRSSCRPKSSSNKIRSQTMKLEGNTILITGATSGIGRGLAEAFHKLGNKVIIAGRRQNLIDEITAANPGMEGLQLDVQDAAAVSKFTENVAKKYPQLNVLINNAGIAKFESWSDDKVDLEIVRSIIHTNITSVIQLTAELLPLLRKQKNATMITTTSGLAFVPLTAAPTYSASKAFLHSWLQSVRSQLNGAVEVLELAPPYVATELGGQAQAEDPRAMPLDEYVAEVISILKSNDTADGEILVERVKSFKQAVTNEKYGPTFELVNSMFKQE